MAGSMNLEFPGKEREQVAMAALTQVMKQLQRLPGGDKKGLEVNILANESEKGSIAAMEEMESFLKMPKTQQGKIAAQAEAIHAKELKRKEKRREQGKPDTNVQLTGQERCCWSCGNVLSDQGFCECKLCKAHLCSVPACWSVHSGFCYGRDDEPESERDTLRCSVIECVVLPQDQRVKPYVRPLPMAKLAADQALQQILRCEALLPLVPLRGFQNGWSDELDDGSRIPQKGLYLVQADWTKEAEGSEVTIYGLTSTSGAGLNGQKAKLGAYHADRERWEVMLPSDEKPKLLKGVNLRTARGSLAPQNLRASTILSSLFNNTLFSSHPVKIPGPVDNRVVLGDEELAAPARGDVWALRVDGAFQTAAALKSFSFAEFEGLWGIFQCMQVPADSGTPFFMGILDNGFLLFGKLLTQRLLL